MSRKTRAIYRRAADLMYFFRDFAHALWRAGETVEKEKSGVAAFEKKRLRFGQVEGGDRGLFHRRIRSRYRCVTQIDLWYRAITERDQPSGGKWLRN